MNNGLLQSVMTNVVFVTEFLVIIVASFLIAWIFEKAAKRFGALKKVEGFHAARYQAALDKLTAAKV